LTAERDGLLLGLENVSSAYEAAGKDRDRLLEVMREKDAALAKAHAAAHRAAADKATLATDVATRDTTIAELQLAKERLTAAKTAAEASASEHRQHMREAEDKVVYLQKELQAAQSRGGDAIVLHTMQESRNVVDALKARMTVFEARETENLAALAAANAKVAKTKEEVAVLEKKLAKRDERVKQLKDELAAATASASAPKGSKTPLPLSLSRSASSSSTPMAYGGGEGEEGGSWTKAKEDLLQMLKSRASCTVCGGKRMKDTVITRCFHTFCKECVDERIRLRARKCPQCNQVFAESEVKPIYLT
jgi:E3 ubiquitin-protein ligase BRE1